MYQYYNTDSVSYPGVDHVPSHPPMGQTQLATSQAFTVASQPNKPYNFNREDSDMVPRQPVGPQNENTASSLPAVTQAAKMV